MTMLTLRNCQTGKVLNPMDYGVGTWDPQAWADHTWGVNAYLVLEVDGRPYRQQASRTVGLAPDTYRELMCKKKEQTDMIESALQKLEQGFDRQEMLRQLAAARKAEIFKHQIASRTEQMKKDIIEQLDDLAYIHNKEVAPAAETYIAAYDLGRSPLPGWGEHTPFDPFKGFKVESDSGVSPVGGWKGPHALQQMTTGDRPYPAWRK